MFQFIFPGHSLSSREIKAITEAGSEPLKTVGEELLSCWLVVMLSQTFDVTQDYLPKVVTALVGWTIPQQSIIKRESLNSHRHSYSPV